ncbi:MAG: hypothetical protein KKF44_09090 [Nanoarchaeota archaeon]|nr:hypothetical protein [Nanoarchaeota archaeon]
MSNSGYSIDELTSKIFGLLEERPAHTQETFNEIKNRNFFNEDNRQVFLRDIYFWLRFHDFEVPYDNSDDFRRILDAVYYYTDGYVIRGRDRGNIPDNDFVLDFNTNLYHEKWAFQSMQKEMLEALLHQEKTSFGGPYLFDISSFGKMWYMLPYSKMLLESGLEPPKYDINNLKRCTSNFLDQLSTAGNNTITLNSIGPLTGKKESAMLEEIVDHIEKTGLSLDINVRLFEYAEYFRMISKENVCLSFEEMVKKKGWRFTKEPYGLKKFDIEKGDIYYVDMGGKSIKVNIGTKYFDITDFQLYDELILKDKKNINLLLCSDLIHNFNNWQEILKNLINAFDDAYFFFGTHMGKKDRDVYKVPVPLELLRVAGIEKSDLIPFEDELSEQVLVGTRVRRMDQGGTLTIKESPWDGRSIEKYVKLKDDVPILDVVTGEPLYEDAIDRSYLSGKRPQIILPKDAIITTATSLSFTRKMIVNVFTRKGLYNLFAPDIERSDDNIMAQFHKGISGEMVRYFYWSFLDRPGSGPYFPKKGDGMTYSVWRNKRYQK